MQSSSSKFIRHIACPRCKSRDNCGEYDDHFWCFGCKYHKVKDDIESVRIRYNQRSLQEIAEDPYTISTTPDIPPDPLRWLLSYEITLKEIEDYGVGWNDEQQLLVLMKTPEYWQARCFGNQKTKYLSKGTKPLTFYGYADKLVCVEDIVSAIKLSRLSPEWCALPLLGCSLSDDWIQCLSGHFKSVVMWLDRDKAKDALAIARNLKQRGFNASIVVSPLDPKEYSKEELNAWLKTK
jgi:hypothetical protein